MKQLSFSEEYRYREDQTGIPIEIILSRGEHRIEVTAAVDPGAAVCLFANEVGQALAIRVEDGIPIRLSTLGGPLEAYGHEVTIQTGSIEFESLIYFAKHPGLPRNLLGRQGWLRKLRLALIDYDNLLFFSAYNA